MLDVKRLVLLRDLAEYGTVTAVADLHRVTPSAVSQQLRALEAEAGAALLRREGRTVRLTAAGSALAAQSELVVAALERAQSAVRALDGEVGGELLVGCFPSGLETVAAPLAEVLVRRHPRLRPRIVEAEPEAALPMLKQRELDLTLTYHYPHLGTPPPDGITAHPLFNDPLMVAVPEELRADVEAAGVGALADRRWIGTPPPSACLDVLVHACQSVGFTPAMEHSYHDLRAALPLVAAGLGVTILPTMMCRAAPAGVALLPLPGKGRTVAAAVRTGAEAHSTIAAALAALREPAVTAHPL